MRPLTLLLIPALLAGSALAIDPTGSRPAAEPAVTQPADAAAILDRAIGLALVEVVSVAHQDLRPSDGALVEIVTFKTLRAAGWISEIPADKSQVAPIRIIVDVGGRHLPGTPPYKPQGPILPGTMKEGQRYWIAFKDLGTKNSLTPAPLTVWPDDDSAPRKQLQAALDTKRFPSR